MAIELDVRDLVGHPGSARTVSVAEPVAGLAMELARVPEGLPVEARLLLESVVEGVLATGPITGTMECRCARCLKQFSSSFSVGVQELFVPGARPQDDEYPLVEGFVDVEPLIRDAVLLAMPFAPLCRPDCRGLCERCGGDRNLGECSCVAEPDSRWAALASLDLLELGGLDAGDGLEDDAGATG